MDSEFSVNFADEIKRMRLRLLNLQIAFAHAAAGTLDDRANRELLKADGYYAFLDLDEKIEMIAQDRADNAYAQIDAQTRLQDDGIERAKSLKSSFNLLSDGLFEGFRLPVELDLLLQVSDVNIMTVLSDSQLKLAANFDTPDSAAYKSAQTIVSGQFDKIEAFENDLDAINSVENPDGDEGLYSAAKETYIRMTLRQAFGNAALAQKVLERLENGIQAMHYWHKKTRPQEQEAAYERDLQKVYEQRVQILLSRAVKLHELAGKVDGLARK